MIVLKTYLSCNCYNGLWQFHYSSERKIHGVSQIIIMMIIIIISLLFFSLKRIVDGLIEGIRVKENISVGLKKVKRSY